MFGITHVGLGFAEACLGSFVGRRAIMAVAGLALVGVAGTASAQVCPPAQLMDETPICWGDPGAAENTVTAVYDLLVLPFPAGSTFCVDLDFEADLETGGWETVTLSFSDDAAGALTTCLAGPEGSGCDVEIPSGAFGCADDPPVNVTANGTFCYTPGAGAESVTVAITVEPCGQS